MATGRVHFGVRWRNPTSPRNKVRQVFKETREKVIWPFPNAGESEMEDEMMGVGAK